MSNIFDQRVSEEDSRAPPTSIEDESVDFSGPLEENESEIPRTSQLVKVIVQELLKLGYLEESARQDLFRSAIVLHQEIHRALEPLDLRLKIDSHRGVAFLVVDTMQSENLRQTDLGSHEDAWSHPLVRKQRLTLEQSLLVAILRQAFVMHEQEFGVGQSSIKIAVDELLPSFLTYVGQSGSDTRDENRLLQLLDQLKSYGIVSEVDKKHEVTIRPLIAHLASPESLQSLLNAVKDMAMSSSGGESTVESAENE